MKYDVSESIAIALYNVNTEILINNVSFAGNIKLR